MNNFSRKQRSILVYHQTSCNVPTIRSFLKQEYKGLETWIFIIIYINWMEELSECGVRSYRDQAFDVQCTGGSSSRECHSGRSLSELTSSSLIRG